MLVPKSLQKWFVIIFDNLDFFWAFLNYHFFVFFANQIKRQHKVLDIGFHHENSLVKIFSYNLRLSDDRTDIHGSCWSYWSNVHLNILTIGFIIKYLNPFESILRLTDQRPQSLIKNNSALTHDVDY